MMRRGVWKFPLDIGGITAARVSATAQPVLVALDPATGCPAIWLENNPDAPQVDRGFVVYGTGHEIEGDGGYPYDIHVGSVIDRRFVWHVYERRA